MFSQKRDSLSVFKFGSAECVLLFVVIVAELINITCGHIKKLISNVIRFYFAFPPLFAAKFQMAGNLLASGTEGDLELLKSSSVVTAAINSEHLEKSLTHEMWK